MSKAVELFTAVPKMHNCAQAVVCGCGREDLKDAMASCGGGKAPDGRCGALHGALQIVPETSQSALSAEFEKTLGSTLCRELKLHGVPCAECVAAGADLAEKYR